LQVKNGDDKVDLPVIAFFGTARAHGATRQKKSRIGRQIFKEGYNDWWEMRSSAFQYENWLASYEVLQKNNKEYPNTGIAFIEAIMKANPYIQQIENVGGKLWLKVKIDNYQSDLLPIELHSDGIRFYTEMVAELAYRCIVLNGYHDKKAVNESYGVVMIDELDLHLHPNWQRHVVGDLKKAFPNIQFVVTTHSAFIVQSLESDEIWNLDKNMDISPDDLKIDNVATAVMGVESPYSIKNEKEHLQSIDFLKMLEVDVSIDELTQNLNEIENPAVRAFLELRKESKGK
jgi:predicted ATP-binding protein involved in virulence